jgi:hypothetical protein
MLRRNRFGEDAGLVQSKEHGLVKTLETPLDSDDELEIIPDRRRANPSVEAKPDAAEQPSVDRRHRHVDSRLKLDGFAIVPVSATGAVRPLGSGRGSRHANASQQSPVKSQPPTNAAPTTPTRSPSMPYR